MPDHGLVDIAVIGGGVNGTGIARDAAGRGLKVLLCEKGDLAEGTSSRSGKLIHGGLRYLEYFEFRLVREALKEREVLLAAAPHIIWPMRFVLPHSPEQRPAWLIRLGLFLYDHLGGRRRLPGCRRLDLRTALEGQPIKDEFRLAFEYSDCWVDDARLVVLNAVDAAARGTTILTRTAATSARRADGLWQVDMRGEGGEVHRAGARILVNTAGPWVEDVISRVAGRNTRRHVRLIKGSHIIVPKFWEGGHAYLLQNTDKRVVFVNPYEEDLCLVGTTDIPYSGSPDDVAADDGEIDYLIGIVNRYAKRQLKRADVLRSYAGVRPLFDDSAANPSAVTRDYAFDLDAAGGQAPLISVFGGKITTFRRLAEHAMERLAPFLPGCAGSWTRSAKLPGGDIAGGDFEGFVAEVAGKYPFLTAGLARHYGRLYGTRAHALIGNARRIEDLGDHFGGLFYEREARFVRETEWAQTAEDVLDRRTKHGLHLNAAEIQRFREWMAAV
ncbi:MAG: glycerol-3-phosphate dehydrogenase [Methylobacteriaceae bacterium]|nr:glycerol-3-phosphate dehydrogenase [Methylobacteriaceae bacterium]